MPRPIRPGKSLERLIASIERVLGKDSNVRVESPAFVPDRITGELREHDVMLTVTAGHHSTRIAAECRDRSRKVTVNEIEAFFSKCQDTGVNQCVLVSSRGFTRTALSKAKHLGIRALSLTEVESFNWLGTGGITGHTRQVKHVSWLFEPEPKLDPLPALYTVLTSDGNPVQSDVLITAARAEFQKVPHASTPPPRGRKTIIFPAPGLTLRDDASNVTHPIGRAIVEVEYEVLVEFVPFKLVSYVDTSSGQTITDVAIADVKLGPVPGKVMVVYKESEGGSVVFLPDTKPDA